MLITGLLAATLTVPLTLSGAVPAQAAFAPSGSGLHKGAIDWIEWGQNGVAIANGTTAASTRNIDGQQLKTTCAISDIVGSGGVKAYRSGSYEGDALDDLYNRGGVGSANSLVYGLSTALGQTASFNVACSATLGPIGAVNPAPVSLGGLVIADAESSNKSQGEFISAKPAQQDATWRIIERSRSAGCDTNVMAELSGDKTLKLSPDAEQCRSRQPNSGNGPMAIGYMNGATGADITLKGGGASAVALGVVFEADFGDAPRSYGAAGALFQPTWTGGELSKASTNVFDVGFQLGKPSKPVTRLGANLDSDIDYQGSADATGDDVTGPGDTAALNDEDAITALGRQTVVPGQAYPLNNVACTGPGFVSGWIDWNVNGTFDALERSSPVECTASSVNLAWTVPADVKNTNGSSKTFLRLRIAKNPAEVTMPTGMTTSGEVEDHALQLSVPTLTIQKNVVDRVAASDQFTLFLASEGATTRTATTTGSLTGLQNAQIGPETALPGRGYSFGEAMAAGTATPMGEYQSHHRCTASYLDGSQVVLKDFTAALEGFLVMPGVDARKGAPAVVCVFGNNPRPAELTVQKKWMVNGQAYDHGSQSDGLTADLTLSVSGTAPRWNVAMGGYSAGQKVAVGETMAIAQTMPGCRVDSQQLRFNGTIVSAATPQQLTLAAGSNTATITNTVICNTTVNLIKEVVGGTAKATDWTVSAHGPSGAAVVQGAGQATGKVAAGETLQLAESNGSPLYVQNDSRTAAERSAAPLSTGSWSCTAQGTSTATVSGVLALRDGSGGSITPPLGSNITCRAVNRTALLTLLKTVKTGTAVPADWMLLATPGSGAAGLRPVQVGGNESPSAANTFQVRPGHSYQLTENGLPGGYLLAGLERFDGSNPDDEKQLANPANWTRVDEKAPIAVAASQKALYRFVNKEAPRFQLPFTGGGGSTVFLAVGGFLMVLSLGLGLVVSRRRTNRP